MSEISAELRTAIVVTKGTEAPAVANASAILMGQLALLEPRIFTSTPPIDTDGKHHAGIQYNVVILTGKTGQLDRLAQNEESDVTTVVFGTEGRALSNSFQEYKDLIEGSSSDQLGVFAVGVSGPHDKIVGLTKQFSVFKG